jgi:hypothetical protein
VGAVVSVVVGGAAGGSCGWLWCTFGCFSPSVSPGIMLPIAFLVPAFYACFSAITEPLCWHDDGAHICFLI